MIVLLLIELDVAPTVCRLMVEAAALLSLHALGRWYQRALSISEASLSADLARLAAAYPAILDKYAQTGRPGFLCAASGGQWAGSITHRRSEVTGRLERVLDIRTFLPADAVESSTIWQNRTSDDRPPVGALRTPRLRPMALNA